MSEIEGVAYEGAVDAAESGDVKAEAAAAYFARELGVLVDSLRRLEAKVVEAEDPDLEAKIANQKQMIEQAEAALAASKGA